MFTGDDVLSAGKATRLALAKLAVSGATVLLLEEPTNNLDPAFREDIPRGLEPFSGAIVPVSRVIGAVTALNLERVSTLPEGNKDHGNRDYKELISPS